MTGNNEALDMMLELCAGDSMKVFLPTMSVDRTDYLNNVAAIGGTPLLYGIPYPGMATSMYNGVKTDVRKRIGTPHLRLGSGHTDNGRGGQKNLN